MATLRSVSAKSPARPKSFSTNLQNDGETRATRTKSTSQIKKRNRVAVETIIRPIGPHRPSTKPHGQRGASVGDITRNRRTDAFGCHESCHHDDEEMEEMGQDIKFIDVPSSSVEKDEQTRAKGHPISPQEILEQSQETHYEEVYEVNLHAVGVTVIPNLDKFTNLRSLDLSCNSIKNVDNLSRRVKGLRELKLYGNELTSMDHLESMVELTTLQLQHNRIQTIGGRISCLKKLKVLRLDSNCLTKLESQDVASCSQLTYLDISSNSIDNLTSLNCLSSLEELHATHNNLQRVQDLSRCKKLNEVNLAHNKLTDISGLKRLPHLAILHLSNNTLTTACLKSLGKLKSLQNLDLSCNRLTDVSCIPELFPSLEVLNVSDNLISSWSSVCSLDRCGSLSELYIATGNPFCQQDRGIPGYPRDLQDLLPNLEILDGAHVKKTSSKSTPIMRPMSAASALSSRQVENQLRNVEHDLASYGASLQARFESMRSTMDTLPLEPPSPRPPTSLSLRSLSTCDGSRPVSRCSSRNRIADAQAFASKNFAD